MAKQTILNKPLNVVCVLRQGGKVGYDASWVEKLMHGVQRNLTLPYQFTCLSDCDVPCNRIPLENTGAGFWSKLQLFRPGQFTGPVLYIDLDAIVCQNIDEIVHRVQDQNFVMWLEPRTHVHSSAIMWWQGDHSHLWDLYKSQPESHWQQLHTEKHSYGDQGFIADHVSHTVFQDHVPNAWFHLASKRDNEFDFSEVKILQFIKTHTKPSTLPDHPMVQQHWH